MIAFTCVNNELIRNQGIKTYHIAAQNEARKHKFKMNFQQSDVSSDGGFDPHLQIKTENLRPQDVAEDHMKVEQDTDDYLTKIESENGLIEGDNCFEEIVLAVKVEETEVQMNPVQPHACEECNATYDGLASYNMQLGIEHGVSTTSDFVNEKLNMKRSCTPLEHEEGCSRFRKTDNETVTTSSLGPNLNEESHTSAGVRRKHRAIVYDYFNCQKSGGTGEKIGICTLCNRVIKMKNYNTSGLKRHLKCRHIEAYNKSLLGDSKKTTELSNTAEQGTRDIIQTEFDEFVVDWVAREYLPLGVFDDQQTQKLSKFLISNISVPKRTSLKSKVIARFEKMQCAVFHILKENNSKIAFTIDGWTSISNKSYYGITAHYADSNWKLQSLVLDFLPSRGKHTGKDIADLFFNCVKSCNLQSKVVGITVDNASADTKFLAELSHIMKAENINDFDPEDRHFCCFAHILNLVGQDILKHFQAEEEEGQENDENEDEYIVTGNANALQTLRQFLKKLRKSEEWNNKLKTCCEIENVKYISLNIDVCTRWNSTCDMLKIALSMKAALNALWANNVELAQFQIKEDDWELFSRLVKLLKVFKAFSMLLFGEKYVTLSLVIIGFNMLLEKLEREITQITLKAQQTTADASLLVAYSAGKDKLLKYYSKTNWIYCVVLILDPRHKKHAFLQTDWGKEILSYSIEKFENMFQNEYCDSVMEFSPKTSVEDAEDDDLDIFALFNKHRKHNHWRDELDKYYNSEPAEKHSDILCWWRENQYLYPTVAKMAKDFFAIPATSVPADWLFSKAGLTLRKHRNGLADDSARYLLCLNSWCTSTLIGD